MITVRDIGFIFGFKTDKESEKQVENSIQGLKDMATKLLGAIGIGFSLAAVNQLTEEFRTVNRAIGNAVEGLNDVEESERAILEAANASRTSYEAMADTVTDLVKSSSEMFPIEDAVAFSSTVTKFLKTAGRGDDEIQSMMDGLNKSFQKGAVDTETLNVMLEQCPEAANLLSESLGVAKESLLDMATDGQISCQQLKDAFLNSSDEIDAAFGNMDLSISEALQNVRNNWGFLLADFDEVFGVTNAISRAIVRISNAAMSTMERIKTRLQWLADKLGGADNLLQLIAMSAGAIFLAFNFPSITSGLKLVGSLIQGIQLKTMAVVAAIVLAALLVQDFVAFMKGDNSLTGEMLEKFGINADDARSKVKELWSRIKDVIGVVKQFGTALGGKLFEAAKQVLPLLSAIAMAILPSLVRLGKDVVGFITQIAQDALPYIVQFIGRLLPLLMSIIDTVLPMLADLLDTIIPLVMDVVEAILPPLLEIVEALLPIFAEIVEALLPVFQTILEAVFDVLEALLPVFEPIVELIKNLAETLLPVIVDLLDAILPILEPILGVLEPIADVLGTIIEAIAKVVGWAASGFGWVIDKVFGGGTDTTNAEKVNAYAKGTSNSSETFIAGEEGPELVTGAAGRKIFTALETGRIFESMALLGKAATARPSSITTASNSRTITQYNEFVNTFNGDRAGQQKSAAAMNSASGDAISVMARALQFAR